jgi:SNF2 family DNA or RNA helicase
LKITFWKGVFVADHRGREEENLLKRAGFVPHEPTLCEPAVCRGCRARIGRRYWSSRVEHATRLRSYCTQRALDVMKLHLAKLAQSRAVDANIVVPAPAGMRFEPYQKAGIAYAIARKDTLIGDDMGLGKTVESLGFANVVRPRSILVVGPATLALNWKLEAGRWLTGSYRCYIPESGSDVVPPQGDEPLLVITNYEKVTGITPRRQRVALASIETDLPAVSRLSQSSTEQLTILAEGAKADPEKTPILCSDPSRPGRLRAIRRSVVVEAARILGWPRLTSIVLPPETVLKDLDLDKALKQVHDTPLSRSLRRPWGLGIFDEAQALKNPESQRSRAVLGRGGLYHRCQRSLFLSGTPLENYTKEIWPLAAALAPAKFGDWWKFAHRYCGLHSEERAGKKVWVADGCTNHSELQQRLRTSFMIRRLKTDVLPELPPKRRQLIVLDEKIDWSRYPQFQRWRELYERAYEEALARLEAARSAVEYKQAVRKLDSVTVGFTETSDIRHKTGLLKLPACLRYADELLCSGIDCLVIYAHHQDVLQKISEHYGETSCVIYGDTPMDARIPIVGAFQAGQKKIFIGGLKAAGVGITLTRASTCVFFETDWNPATIKQAEDRLCRFGQKKMVHAIHPVLDGSLDANIMQKMLSKQEAVDKVLDHLPESEKLILKKEGLASS